MFLARSNTAKKITAIIEREFSQEINAKEKEVLEVQERLHRASKVLHLLRYVIVTDFYNRKQCQNSQSGEAKQTQIHPAIKQLIGKSPKVCDNSVVSAIPSSSGSYSTATHSGSASPLHAADYVSLKTEKVAEEGLDYCPVLKRSNETDEESRPKKIPRYIPPKSGIPEPPCPSRGIRHKVRKRIIIGNISKWIPPEWREDAASHKWTMYVRGNKENPDIDDFVNKVRFFLHPSYRPNDVVEVTAAPFCLSRRGWGEFPLRVQLHFKSAFNKPMDIIHHLKLDRTYTGLQTLGSETLVDIWIYADSRNSKRNTGKNNVQPFSENEFQMEMNSVDSSKIKVENDEDSNFMLDFITEGINKTTDSTSKNYDVAVKQEPLQDNVISENSKSTEQLRFYVELDHDYCSSKYINSFEENLTIDHSSTTSSLIDLPIDDVSKQNVEQKKDEEEMLQDINLSMTESSANAELSKGEINPSTSLLTNELNRNETKALPLACSKIQSNLHPLEISIPPAFESSNKHVLVLQNNKTIPVDKLNNEPTVSKINITSSRGISLLKKPPSSNLNEREAQQAVVKLQLSRSVLLNANSNIPALQIAERRNLQNHHIPNVQEEIGTAQNALKVNNQEERELKAQLKQKITLGKDKHKLQSRKEFYDEVFRTIETAKITDIQELLRFITKRMPIVTRDASDSDYRQIHPYACASEEEFFQYSVAKRTACEWNRAKIIRCFLKKKSISEEELWTTKEIMIWTRLHGYTPLCSDFVVSSMKEQINLPNSAITKSTFTCTEPDAFCKWLQIYPSRSNDQLLDSNLQRSNEYDAEIDIVNNELSLESKRSLKEKRENKALSNTKIAVLELETKLMPLHDFVCETATEIGIKISSEEILPNVIYCATSRMIMQVRTNRKYSIIRLIKLSMLHQLLYIFFNLVLMI